MTPLRQSALVLPLLLLGSSLAVFADETAATGPAKPNLDPNRIINASYGFMKSREPEMTATEYALYDKVVGLIATRPDYAMKLLETMMGEKTAPSPAFEFVLGNAYYSSGKQDLAIAHYRAAVQKYPEFVRAWTNLAIACYADGRYAEAAPCFNQAVSLGDRTASTYGLLGFCLSKSDNALAAEMAYEQAYTLDPGNADWVEALVELLAGTKQYARAEALVRQLVRLKPADTKNWMLHASILLAQERKLDALAVLETAAHLKALDQAGRIVLADLYASQGFHAEAVAAYRDVAGDAPAVGAQRLLRYAQSLAATGKISEARQILEKIPTSGADKETVIVFLETKSALALAAKDAAQARQALEDLLQLDALNGRALLGLSELYAQANDVTRARLVAEQAAQLPEFSYQAHLALANLALNAKDYRTTAAHLRAALDLQRSAPLQDYLAKVSALLADHEN